MLNGKWVEFDVRDEVIDFINKWSSKTEINIMKIIDSIGISRAKHYDWKARYGLANEHNAKIPRDHWLEEEEKKAIVKYYQENKTEGYKRLTYMLIDANIVAVSPSSVYRVLKNAGLMRKWSKSPSKKGTGFEQPIVAHQHWHIDISYINIGGTFFYLCVILDGFSRYIINWDIREQMTERDVEVILEQAREKFLLAKPRIISDNGPQFIARDFKEYIRICGMTHVRTSPYYPQSNGKLERVNKTIKSECIRPGSPLSLDDAKNLTLKYVAHYNNVRLHSALGYISPIDCLEGRSDSIFLDRESKLFAAREFRKVKRSKSWHDNQKSSSSSSSLSSSLNHDVSKNDDPKVGDFL